MMNVSHTKYANVSQKRSRHIFQIKQIFHLNLLLSSIIVVQSQVFFQYFLNITLLRSLL